MYVSYIRSYPLDRAVLYICVCAGCEWHLCNYLAGPYHMYVCVRIGCEYHTSDYLAGPYCIYVCL